MRDFLPKEAEMLRRIEGEARKLAKLYGYGEVVTPVLESYELLAAKTGEEVRSRMYAFKDLGGRKVALRPEFTASVARLVASKLRSAPKPLRIFCAGSLYRYDEPQQGRFREFWQSNYELVGSSRPEADAEILLLTHDLLNTAGLRSFRFKVGHVGILRAIFTQEKVDESTQNTMMQLMDKEDYGNAFKVMERNGLSKTCVKTVRSLVDLKGTVISKVLKRIRGKVETYEGAREAVENLEDILSLLPGRRIKTSVEAGFARGLEYYTGMIFEIFVPEMDIALGGGGRYDKLIELFGGEPTPAVGVAHGIDRVTIAAQKQKQMIEKRRLRKVIVIPTDGSLIGQALMISAEIRSEGIPAEVEVMGRKVSKALADASKRIFEYAVIVGRRELEENSVVVKNLRKREQQSVKLKKIAEFIGKENAG